MSAVTQRYVIYQHSPTTAKRLGDGYSSDEAQFKALMDQGVTFGKQYALKSGVALTPEQMALLTGDIVWLVNTTVKMPDGSLQTGIFAGKGGYDITVGGHTQLDGAVTGSTATADKNRLDTGTLGWGDIDNRAGFKTEHQSVGFSTGGSIGSQFAGNMANGLLTGGNNEGHDSSTTHAAVSDGTLIVRNPGQQTQDTSTLSRDVEHASQTLSPIFDKEKEQQRLQQSQLIGEIGSQVADIARTEGQINAINAGKADLAKEKINEPGKGASKEAWEKYNAQLAATEGYKAAQQQWGTGSSVQQAIQAATAAVQGLAGSDLKAALAGAAAPYVAEVIGHYSNLDDAGKVAAHAVVNAALAAAQNQSALAGAAGAATAEIVGIIATQMYGKPVSELDETQKQTVSTLATLAAGLAGGLTGGSTSDTVTAAQAGRTTVENNSLSKKDKINIFDINPMLKIGIEGADGDPLKGGGGNSGSAYNPTGRSGNPMNTKGSNSPAVIGERTYSAHAVDRMQGRGVPPSAVENTIKAGVTYPTNPGTTGYYDSANNLRVIINSKTGDVVTVIPGAPTK